EISGGHTIDRPGAVAEGNGLELLARAGGRDSGRPRSLNTAGLPAPWNLMPGPKWPLPSLKHTFAVIGDEIEKQAALAGAARKNIESVEAGANAGQLLPRAVLDMLGPYSAALYIAERVVQSATFDAELVAALHAKLL